MPLFNRTASVEIGAASLGLGVFGPADKAIKVSNLRIMFDIKKTNKPETNTADISIYNLNQDNRENVVKTEKVLILNAGYADATGLEKLFVGYVVNTNHAREGADIISKIQCEDGSKPLRETKINKPFTAGTGAKKIIQDIIKELPISSQNVDLTGIDDKKFVNGFAASGIFSKIMDNLVGDLNLEWSIQDNELQIIERGKTNQRTALLLSPETGLIGSPEQLQNLNEDDEEEIKPGWRVKSLLFPKITIGNKIAIESRAIKKNTYFKVISVQHIGDTFGNDWNSIIDVEELNA